MIYITRDEIYSTLFYLDNTRLNALSFNKSEQIIWPSLQSFNLSIFRRVILIWHTRNGIVPQARFENGLPRLTQKTSFTPRRPQQLLCSRRGRRMEAPPSAPAAGEGGWEAIFKEESRLVGSLNGQCARRLLPSKGGTLKLMSAI